MSKIISFLIERLLEFLVERLLEFLFEVAKRHLSKRK
jgi:hypothetical protein